LQLRTKDPFPTSEAIEVQRPDIEAKCRTKDTGIMLADLSNMDDDEGSWIEKKPAEIHQRDV
jgi:hypothetical protein